MTTNGVPPEPPVVRRVETSGAAALVDLIETFDELQTVLRCCERLVTELAADGEPEPDPVVVEAVWTMAMLSYARCFSTSGTGVALTEDDLTATQSSGEVLEWHQVLLQLRDHYADISTNPRELFSVGVTQDQDGAAAGVAITSARQPLVDDLTVRQTGAIAYALSGLVNTRIEAQQAEVFEELKTMSPDDLEKLVPLEVAEPTATP